MHWWTNTYMSWVPPFIRTYRTVVFTIYKKHSDLKCLCYNLAWWQHDNVFFLISPWALTNDGLIWNRSKSIVNIGIEHKRLHSLLVGKYYPWEMTWKRGGVSLRHLLLDNDSSLLMFNLSILTFFFYTSMCCIWRYCWRYHLLCYMDSYSNKFMSLFSKEEMKSLCRI